MRCWIVRVVAEEFKASPRKAKGKARAQDPEPPQNGHKRSGPECLPGFCNSGSSNGVFRAPEPPRMVPTPQPLQEVTGSARVDEDIRNPNGSLARVATSKPIETTSKKRKAIDDHERTPNGKLPKPSKAARPTSTHHQGQHRDPYSTPPSPQPPSALDNSLFEARGLRLSTQDTDRTCFPRETTVDTATVFGDDVTAEKTGE